MLVWYFLIRKLIRKGMVDYGCMVFWYLFSCLLFGSWKVLFIISCRKEGEIIIRLRDGKNEIVLVYVLMVIGCSFIYISFCCR